MNLIDIHTHGIDGFDTRNASVEDIVSIAHAHGKQGVNHIVLSVYPGPVEQMRRDMEVIKQAVDIQRRTGVEEHCAGIIGIHLEEPFLNPLMCGALDAASLLPPDESTLKELIHGYEDIVKIITIAPELQGALNIIRRIADAGIIVSMGHSDASLADAEAGHKAGARGITHLFNAMRGIHHREPGLAGYGLINRDIYIEVIADPFHLSQDMLKYIFSVKDPERIIIVSDTVKDTLPITQEENRVADDKGILLGGSMTISESSRKLSKMGIDRRAVEQSVSENPARFLHMHM